MEKDIKIIEKKIRLEDHTVIPLDIVNMEFDDVNAFLEFIYDGKRYLNVHVSKGAWGQWLVYIHPDKEFLRMCHADGICGLCDAKLDPSTPVKPSNELHVENHVVCGYCGKILRYQKSQTLLDLFNELTGHQGGEDLDAQETTR